MKKVCLFLILFFGLVCLARAENEVVIYTSLDQVFSEPILKEFEKTTGIKVKAVYDVEAVKTVGLVNRLIAEKDNPQADVFWNSEIVRTLVLKNKGVLTPYISKEAADIPAQFKDKEGYWTGFSARARVLIYNKTMLTKEDLPNSIFELTDPKWKGKVALANPLFGTAAAQSAGLFALLGDKDAEKFYAGLKANTVVIVDGNSIARDVVQNGELPLAFTDTDDAHVALINGKPVGIIYPDQGEGQIGAFLFPCSVGLIKNSPNTENGKKLVDYLLSKEVESKLAFAECAQIPLRADVKRPADMPSYDQFKPMKVNFEDLAEKIEQAGQVLQNIFIK